MGYSVRTKRRKVLDYLHRRRRGRELELQVRDGAVVVHGGMYSGEAVNYALGFRPKEFNDVIRELRDEGYIAAVLTETGLISSYDVWTIRHLTDKGLREIEELPAQSLELVQRLDLAIQQIQQDPRLGEAQKRRAINWLREGTTIAGTLPVDAIKAILVGAVL